MGAICDLSLPHSRVYQGKEIKKMWIVGTVNCVSSAHGNSVW